MPEPTRKLAAIVFTDIVGFTKLTAEDQQKASDLLDLQRSELKPLVESHSGHWIKEVGDGLILTFDTITNAVQCCLNIQDKARSIENLSLRIGVHLGEILVKEGDIIGDDVNITARIEPFSAPGGIAISNKVNDALVREANFTTKYLGKPQLKGVGQEVKVYCITSHGLPETKLSDVSAKLENKSNWYIYVVSAAAVVLVVGFILLNPFGEDAPDNLSIAVLPFANMSTDKENEYFSDGMTEEILNALAQINTLRVAARTSSFAFKGKNEDIRIIGKKLAVAHVLEGSVRKFGEDIRITAQLIRVSDGYHLWSNTYDRKFKEIFKVQEEISNAIVSQMKIKLFGENIVKRRGITEHPEALDLYMQGRFLWNQNQERAVLRSIEYFEKALEKDPQYALAESAIADGFYSLGVIKRWTVSNEERSIIFQKSEDHARKALRIEPQLGEAFAVLGVLYGGNQISSHWKDDKKTAEEYFKKAINLSPKYTPAYLWYSNMLSPGSKDRKEEAEIMFNKALAIDPLSASVNMRGGELYNIGFKDYEKALSFFDKAFELDPYLVYGSVNFEYTSLLEQCFQWERAEKSWNYAYQTDSTFFGTLWGMTSHYIERGLNDKANKYLKKITDIYLKDGENSPGIIDIYFIMAVNAVVNRDYKSMILTLEKMYEKQPCQTWFGLDYAYGMKHLGRIESAEGSLNQWRQECHKNPSYGSWHSMSPDELVEYEYFHQASINILEDEFESRAAFEKMILEFSTIENNQLIHRGGITYFGHNVGIGTTSPINIFINALMGEYDTAFETIETMINRYESPKYITVHPIFDTVQDNPKFIELKQKMNLN